MVYVRPDLPRPFHVSLPGYAPRLCKYVITKATKAARDPMLGPEITVFPPTWVPHWAPNPNFKAQRYGYNCQQKGPLNPFLINPNNLHLDNTKAILGRESPIQVHIFDILYM